MRLLSLLLPAALAADADFEDHWVIKEVAAKPDGYPRQVIGVFRAADLVPIERDPAHPFNDTLRTDLKPFPGPVVKVRQGGRVRVKVENKMDTPVSVHWHGLHQRNQVWMDGTPGFTECGIPYNSHFTYDFVVTQEPGTHWYHAHHHAEFVDGLKGAIIILPKEGDVDTVDKLYRPTVDEVVIIGDWSHERWMDNAQKYVGRNGEYPGYLEGVESGVPDQPHLPDYPWPAHSILINGRGQFPCEGRYVTEEDCAVIREFGWCWWENQSMPKPAPKPGRPGFCSGQCNPVRPPFVGACSPVPASRVTCNAGSPARLRVINTGAGIPMRFWVDRHNVTIVARDGLPTKPNGPHIAIYVPSGSRYDLIIHCNQKPGTYKLFADLAPEFYPGISHRFSGVGWFPIAGYGLLDYDGAEREPEEPQYPPSAWPDVALLKSYGPEYNTTKFPPAYLEMSIEPLEETTVPPAVARIEAHTKVYGNWWNNVINTTHKVPFPVAGLHLEWWETNDHVPLYKPKEPVLLTNRLGLPLSDKRSFGQVDPRLVPYIARMQYDAENPKWYELVIFNYEGQHHPYHLHGFHAYITGYNYSETPLQQEPNFHNGRLQYSPELYGIPGLDSPARAIVADTFTIPYFGFVVLRIRSDNPGIWLVHCHMDYHLTDGMAFALSVEDDEGRYPVGDPPAGLHMCGEGSTWKHEKEQAGVGAAEAAWVLGSTWNSGVVGQVFVFVAGLVLGLSAGRWRQQQPTKTEPAEAD
eukprot:TRINITY_DN43000_c0_g1_i1.p1 TRINITY_DN43000_c0_g1~~TRINITY_DN43000_c0_g1_i1.p1  ORF type:complete len:749 (+),score=225.39 TRINITY_DN43000_c0_g1_i1:50-2296(+)